MPLAFTPPVAIHRAMSTSPVEERYRQSVHRVRAEYRDMPGLCLTFDQACRLWALDADTCRRVLQDLVAEGSLAVSDRGAYVKRTAR